MLIVKAAQTTTQNPEVLSLCPIYRDYLLIRKESEDICRPLEIEDYGIQTMPDVSPPKWHLAHTSWFFETFILKPYAKNHIAYHPQYEYLFNSYYQQVGAMHPRPERGLLSRPTVEEVYAYRHHIDKLMCDLLSETEHKNSDEIIRRSIIGLQHEQQHQELLLTDIKHIFAANPLKPIYREFVSPAVRSVGKLGWYKQPAGLYQVGHSGDSFAFDNESPQHKVYLESYQIASRLTTNEEYLAFIKAGGYQNPAYWLSDGWRTVQTQKWQQPLYWSLEDEHWFEFSLAGLRPLDLTAPVSHVSFYEACAYACWQQKRLATEMEWEVVAKNEEIKGNFRESAILQPIAPEKIDESEKSGMTQLFGDLWEWTQSSYSAYPGYQAAAGALGEYNGKFMSNQFILRGGSCVTSRDHVRASYRNFFYPADRWQYTGIRLAETI